MPRFLHKNKHQSRRPLAQDYSDRRLEFLWRFLAGTGTSLSRAAGLMGVCPATVTRWLTRDDIALSRISQLTHSLGYTLRATLTIVNTAPYVWYPVEEGSRLDFLRFNIEKATITKKEIAKRIGIEAASLCRWLSSDDIAISRLVQLCETMGWTVHFDFSPKTVEADFAPGLLSYNIHIANHSLLFRNSESEK